MRVSPAFKAAIVEVVAKALPRLIDQAWALAERRQELTEGDPRAAAGKAAVGPGPKHFRRGAARQLIRATIGSYREHGVSRDELRRALAKYTSNPVSENTLKRGLMDLRKADLIETRNSRWYSKELGSDLGVVRTVRPLKPREPSEL